MEGRPIWIYLALGAVVLIVGFAVVKKTLTSPQAIATVQSEQMRQAPTAAGSATISIASSNTKQDWLHQVVQTFNAASKTDTTLQVGDRPIFVKVMQENIDGKKVDYRSGTMISDTLNGKIKPTILSPGNESWILKFKREWQLVHHAEPIRDDTPILVRTPLVIAMWQSRAKALGCWPSIGFSSCIWG